MKLCKLISEKAENNYFVIDDEETYLMASIKILSDGRARMIYRRKDDSIPRIEEHSSLNDAYSVFRSVCDTDKKIYICPIDYMKKHGPGPFSLETVVNNDN